MRTRALALSCVLSLSSGCGLLLDVSPPGQLDGGASVDARTSDGAARIDGAGVERDASLPRDDGGAPTDGGVATGDASRADASAPDAGAMCMASLDHAQVTCATVAMSVVSVRADLMATFVGCACIRAVIRAEDSTGRAWNISDEDTTDGVVAFDASNPFVLGGANTGLSFDVEVCCQTEASPLICVSILDVPRVGCG